MKYEPNLYRRTAQTYEAFLEHETSYLNLPQHMILKKINLPQHIKSNAMEWLKCLMRHGYWLGFLENRARIRHGEMP